MKKTLLIIAIVLCLTVGTPIFADCDSSARSCALMEVSSGRILYGKNIDERLPMASTTKIMTAIVVLENTDIDRVVKIPHKAVGIEGSSIYLCAEEKLSIRELLYGLMLRSGNDCAVALAITVGGSIEGFVNMMNDKASEMGLKNTHFVNPHGLHADNHYTSAKDLATISAYALQNNTFKQITSTTNINISNEMYDYPRVLVNKNKLLNRLDGATGVKTGYTKKAGRCFVGSIEKNGMELVCVVLNCGPMFEETQHLLEYGVNNYTMQQIIPANKLCMSIWDVKNNKPTYYYAPKGFSLPVKNGSYTNIEKQIVFNNNTGEYEILVLENKQLIFSEKLVTI